MNCKRLFITGILIKIFCFGMKSDSCNNEKPEIINEKVSNVVTYPKRNRNITVINVENTKSSHNKFGTSGWDNLFTGQQSFAAGRQTLPCVGLFTKNTSKVFNGFTLFSPEQNTLTYLINNEGRVVHKWTASKYTPWLSAYLLENGDLLRAFQTTGKLSSGGGEGRRVEGYDWEGSLVWELDFSTDTNMQHHDIKKLPDRKILMIVVGKKHLANVWP